MPIDHRHTSHAVYFTVYEQEYTKAVNEYYQYFHTVEICSTNDHTRLFLIGIFRDADGDLCAKVLTPIARNDVDAHNIQSHCFAVLKDVSNFEREHGKAGKKPEAFDTWKFRKWRTSY